MDTSKSKSKSKRMNVTPHIPGQGVYPGGRYYFWMSPAFEEDDEVEHYVTALRPAHPGVSNDVVCRDDKGHEWVVGSTELIPAELPDSPPVVD